MKQWQVLETIFPDVFADNFESVNFEEQSDRLDYWPMSSEKRKLTIDNRLRYYA